MKPLSREDLAHILRHTETLWEEARGKHIFVAGGTGFFGAWLLESLAYCNRLRDLHVRATVLSRNPESFRLRMPHLAVEPCIELLEGDVRSFSMPDDKFDYVLHAAASTSSASVSRPIEQLSILIDGTERMLAFAKKADASRFLFVSSGAVYGLQPPDLTHIPEDYLGGLAWVDPLAVYGEGKRVSEQMCALHALETGIQMSIARCFAFVGPHLPLDQHFAIGNFIGDALAGRNIQIRDDGTPMRSYLYAADLAIWLWTMLFRKSGQNSGIQVFNVGSGEAVSIQDLARIVIEELAPALQIEVAQRPKPGAKLLQYVPDVRRAETSLGLRPLVGLREAIRRTAEWHRQ